ncbi:hypothetical protein EDB19DRAFT_1672257 [Suillus lakei]|nr:hypothetical protein EDB19DRAFT_1672257 [Suillus lakei]
MSLESLLSFFVSAFPYSRLSWSHFDLGVASGIAIFFGGKAAGSALALQPLYGRIWHGWYNTPGCHAIVWKLVRTWLQNSDSPYSERLSRSFGLDGKNGPKYIASQSGTIMQQTRHLAYVLMNSNWRGEEGDSVGRRVSPTPMQLMIVDLKTGTGDGTLPPKNHRHSSLHIIATAASITACAVCARVGDRLSCMMILLGMVSSGTTSFIMRTGKITLERRKPADGVPPGDGMLLLDTRIIILKGKEEDVNAVTKEKLRLKPMGGRSTLLLCAFIASSQVTLQLVFMPFGSLPGQLMFLLSLLVSGATNLYLSANKDDMQSSALLTLLNDPEVKTYQANSRATAAVLACLALCWESGTPPNQILEDLVPINPGPWRAWSEFVTENIETQRTSFVHSEVEQGTLLADLVEDAVAAYDRYMKDNKKTV